MANSKLVIIISAMTGNHVIGNESGLPWSIPEEYQQYLDFVEGNTVIMGRKSYNIYGKDLKKTRVLVITRQASITGAKAVPSLEAAIEEAKLHTQRIFIAGGGSIYKVAIDLADEMYLSFIKGSFEGNTYFPLIKLEDWDIIREENHSRFIFKHFRRK